MKEIYVIDQDGQLNIFVTDELIKIEDTFYANDADIKHVWRKS